MYIDAKFLKWSFFDGGGSGLDDKYMTRAHDIWRHAQSCLTENPTEFDRVDCITSLKRAVNSRLKIIDETYNFQKLPALRSKKQVLEKYQDYGLIRPFLLKELFEVRNLLEHADVEPPTIDECFYHVDIVWYFLKSLDMLVHIKHNNVYYYTSEHSVTLTPDTEWQFTIEGKVNEDLLSNTDTDNVFEIFDYENWDVPDSKKYLKDQTWFSGRLILSDEFRVKIARDYFSTFGYWYSDHKTSRSDI